MGEAFLTFPPGAIDLVIPKTIEQAITNSRSYGEGTASVQVATMNFVPDYAEYLVSSCVGGDNGSAVSSTVNTLSTPLVDGAKSQVYYANCGTQGSTSKYLYLYLRMSGTALWLDCTVGWGNPFWDLTFKLTYKKF